LAKSTNKTLIQILKNTIIVNQRNWLVKLIDALWDSRLSTKGSTGLSPYILVYGKEAKMHNHLELNSLTCVVNTKYVDQASPHRKGMIN
jgi:hypothetical protein